MFSKGHASTLLYAIFRAAGAITDEELLQYRTFGSILEGHPTPLIPWVDVATGSLGQGSRSASGWASPASTSIGCRRASGCCAATARWPKGSMWEAFEHASHYELDNLTAIIDVNRLGQRGETMVGWNVDVYRERAEAFGWNTIEVDGHDVEAIDAAYSEAEATGQAHRRDREDDQGQGRQGRREPAWLARQGTRQSGRSDRGARRHRNIQVDVAKPPAESAHEFPGGALELPRYDVGEEVATRKAYGDALAALGAARGDVVALDGEVGNSTFAEIFAKAHPDRYFEMYIAEQQLLAAAVGLQARGWNPFASTFSAFFSRAYDFIRMAAISRANLRLAGSHAGVSIGEDGPSQMALEDIAAMRAIHSSTVLHPSDANQTAKLVAAMADTDGIVFMRTLRPNTPVIYDADEEFEIGGSRVRAFVRRGRGDARRGRRDVARGAARGRQARRRRNQSPRDRPLLDQADRRRDAAGSGRGHRPNRHSRGSLPRGRNRRSRAHRTRGG